MDTVKFIAFIDQIANAKKEIERQGIQPKRILMSPEAYLAVRFSVECKVFCSKADDNDQVLDMQIIIDHSMADYFFRVLGSNKDELDHQDITSVLNK